MLDRFLGDTVVEAAEPLRFADQVRQRIAERMKGRRGGGVKLASMKLFALVLGCVLVLVLPTPADACS